MLKISQIQIGDVVAVRLDFGTGRMVHGMVKAVEEDIKGGHPGIDFEIVVVAGEVSQPRWAYLHQVDYMVSKALQVAA